jgi:hypothetical protein
LSAARTTFGPLISATLLQGVTGCCKGLHTMVEGGFYDGIQASSGAYKHYCGGSWSESTSGRTIPVINPTTQSECYRVQGGYHMSAAHVPLCRNCRCCWSGSICHELTLDVRVLQHAHKTKWTPLSGQLKQRSKVGQRRRCGSEPSTCIKSQS